MLKRLALIAFAVLAFAGTASAQQNVRVDANGAIVKDTNPFPVKILSTPTNVAPTKIKSALAANTSTPVLAASTTRKGGYCVNTGSTVIYYDDTGGTPDTGGTFPLLPAQSATATGGSYSLPVGFNTALNFISTGTPSYYCVVW